MDTISHIVQGAGTGDATATKTLKLEALLIGAVANTLPGCAVVSGVLGLMTN